MKQYKTYYIHEALKSNPNIFAKSFVFKDYTTGVGIDTNFTLGNNDVIETLYNYANYEFFDRMGDNNPVATLQRLWNRFITNHTIELSDMLSALYSKYNPLENYNKHGHIEDSHTGSDSISGTTGNTRTLNTTDETNGSVSATQTLNTKDSTDYDSTHTTANTSYTDTHATPLTEIIHKESSYDSENTRVVSSESTNAVTTTDNWGNRTSTLTNDGNDATTHTGTIGNNGTNSDTKTSTGTITDVGTNGTTTTYNSHNLNEDTTHGNIGVMTSQSMINEEMKLRKHSFIDYVITYFVATNCIYSDGIDFSDFR